jgi:uncharacterized membrane protein
MPCPKCNAAIKGPGERCAVCNHPFGVELTDKLALFFGLHSEYEYLKSVTGSLLARTDKVALAIRDLEVSIGRIVKQQAEELNQKTVSEQTAPKLEAIPAGPAAPPKMAPVQPVQTPAQSPASPEPAIQPGVPAPTPKAWEFDLGQKWLLIVGIVLMLFGIGYFLKYSFDQGWIGPAGRVALAYLWGIIMLVGGNYFQRKNYRIFGLYVVGGGIAVLYFATYAAFQIYPLLSQWVAFSIMVLITLVASVAAIQYNAKWLAVLGLAGGFLTPVMLGGMGNHWALMIYLTILNIGLLGIAFYKKWDLLNILGFSGTYILFISWFHMFYKTSGFWPALLFLNIFFLIYSFIPFTYQFFQGRNREPLWFIMTGLNSFVAFGYSYALIASRFSAREVSLIAIAYTLIYLVLATLCFRNRDTAQEPLVMYIAEAALFLFTTFPLLLSGRWVPVFWVIQSLCLLWVGVRLKLPKVTGGAYLAMALIIAKFVFFDLKAYYGWSLWQLTISEKAQYLAWDRIVTTDMVLLGLYLFARLAWKEKLRLLTARAHFHDSRVIFTVWSCLLFILLNIEVASFFHFYLEAAGLVAISVLWAFFSVVLMGLGLGMNILGMRKTAIVLLFVTAAKVLLWDTGDFSTPYRIVSLLVVGLVLVGASFLYYRFRNQTSPGEVRDATKEQHP